MAEDEVAVDPAQDAEGDDTAGEHAANEAAQPDVELAFGVPVTESRGQRVLHPSPDELLDTVEALRADGFTLFHDVIGVDYLTHGGTRTLPATVTPERFEVVLLLMNPSRRERIRLRVQAGTDAPSVPSLFDQFPGAETPEREVYDMFGIEFENHPDLCRILMPEDWVGHPLRKDYAIGRIPVQFKDAPGRR